MTQNIFLAIALCGCGTSIKAQRDNVKVRYISNKTEKLDAAKGIKDTLDERVTVEVTKTGISIIPASHPADALKGDIAEVGCIWKEAFSNGKTIINTVLTGQHGDPTNATVTLEGADGKITILLETQEFPGRKLRLLVDRHEELN
jgi:hypothetical protein